MTRHKVFGRPPCKVCRRPVGKRGIALYDTPSGPVAVCGPKCLAAYNGPASGNCSGR